MSRQIDRIRQIVAIVEQGLATAQDLASRLHCSERTIYRDIEMMKAARSPIQGEAGVGYVLRTGRHAQ